MTGFLGRLAARMVGPAPMLTPRQPSMFEAARLVDSVGELADGRLADSVEAVSLGNAARPAAISRKENPGLPASDIGRMPDRRSRRGRQSLLEPPGDSSPGVPPNPSTTALAVAAEHPRIFPPPSVAADARVVARGLPASDETHRRGTLAARAPLYPAPLSSAVSPRVAVASGVSRGSPEPVVHVSIGRVELRTQAPAKPIRHHDKPQGTSLDDYLRQRGDRARP